MTTITAPAEQEVLSEVPKQLYIAGQWRDGSKGSLRVEDPSTGETLCEVADASTDDAKAALDAAAEAGPEWANHPPRERGETLLVLTAAGSVGMIAAQLAASCGVTAIGFARLPIYSNDRGKVC